MGTGVLITSQSVTLLANAVTTLDITGYIAAHLGQQVTILLISEAASAAYCVTYNSREAGSNTPQLTIGYVQRLLNPTTYAYDTAGRRTSVQTPALLSTYSYDAADQLLTIQTGAAFTTFGYDANGSTTTVQTPLGMTTYGWDARNRLSQIQPPSGGRYTQVYRYDDLRVGQGSPNGADTFLYDAFGSGSGSGSTVDALLGSGGSAGGADLPNVLLWQRQPGNGSVLTQVYAQDSNSGSGLVRAIGSSAGAALNRQFHTDAQGNTEALTTGSQSVEADYTLDAFGNVLAGSASNNPIVFGGGLGYWQEPDLGMEYIRARWLSPSTGTWLSQDPVTSEPKYSFVHNSPTWKVDPSGLAESAWWDWHKAWAYGKKEASIFGHYAQREYKQVAGSLTEIKNLITKNLPEMLQFAADPELALKAVLRKGEGAWSAFAEGVAKSAYNIGIDRLPGWVPAPFFIGGIVLPKKQWDGLRQNALDPFQAFFPPFPFSSDGIRWQAGFLWGVIETLGDMVGPFLTTNPSTQAKRAFKTAADFYHNACKLIKEIQKEGLVKFLGEAWHKSRNSFFNFFEDIAKAPKFVQGKMTAIIVVQIISLILLAISVVGTAASIARFFQNGGSILKLVQALKAGGVRAAASEFKLYAARQKWLDPVKPLAGKALPPSPYVEIYDIGEDGELTKVLVRQEELIKAKATRQMSEAAPLREMHGRSRGMPKFKPILLETSNDFYGNRRSPLDAFRPGEKEQVLKLIEELTSGQRIWKNGRLPKIVFKGEPGDIYTPEKPSRKTGYDDQRHVIFVSPNVFPADVVTIPTMSARAALAHELGEARYGGRQGEREIFEPTRECMATVWAIMNVPTLSNADRKALLSYARFWGHQTEGLPEWVKEFFRKEGVSVRDD